MTEAFLKYQIEKSNPSSDVYRVSFEVIDVQNIPAAIFVFDAEHDEFLHVASTYDINNWPASREEALAANKIFYRRNAVVRDLSSVGSATYFDTVTRSRILVLVKSWNKNIEFFTGTDTILVSAG
jgi:hypothetical protein